MYARETDPTIVLFNEEVRFHLVGYVNSNNTYWSVQCPTLIHDFSVYDVTVSAWCDINGSTTAITETSSFFWDYKITATCVTLRHRLLTPVWYDRNWALSSGTQHNSSHSKKFYTLFIQCLVAEEQTADCGLLDRQIWNRVIFTWAYKVCRNNHRTEDDVKESIQNIVCHFHQQNFDVQWCVPAEWNHFLPFLYIQRVTTLH